MHAMSHKDMEQATFMQKLHCVTWVPTFMIIWAMWFNQISAQFCLPLSNHTDCNQDVLRHELARKD